MPSDYSDYYELLDVTKEATDADIRQSFRRLSLKAHPDRSTGDINLFRRLKKAQTVLTESRDLYDKYGESLMPPRGSHLSAAIAKLGPLLFALASSFLTGFISISMGGTKSDAFPAGIFMGVVAGLTMQTHR